MANIKTHLRELSFAVKVGVIKNDLRLDDNFLKEPKNFYNTAAGVISNNISSARNIIVPEFDYELLNIIDNGFKLGNAIFYSRNFQILPNDNIYWLGNDTQKNDLIDVKIGKYGFSLKEDSFILENMGLYKFLNLLTSSNYERGLHIFLEFSPNEYNEWFLYSWTSLVKRLEKCGKYIYQDRNYFSKITLEKEGIVLNYDDEEITCIPIFLKNWNDYMHYTKSKQREKVFSKWISEELFEDQKYLELKSSCAKTAGINICNYINRNLNSNNLKRFLQIYETEYFYAKTTNKKLSVYKVPSLADFTKTIKIEKIDYSVPISQLNIITIIKNIINQNILILRNECRFSHGQFNGTPEAKMYYNKNADLSNIYISII
jgi:hypothetical protein